MGDSRIHSKHLIICCPLFCPLFFPIVPLFILPRPLSCPLVSLQLMALFLSSILLCPFLSPSPCPFIPVLLFFAVSLFTALSLFSALCLVSSIWCLLSFSSFQSFCSILFYCISCPLFFPFCYLSCPLSSILTACLFPSLVLPLSVRRKGAWPGSV